MSASDRVTDDIVWSAIARRSFAEWRRAVAVGVIAAAAFAGATHLMPERWVSEAEFMPQANRTASSFGGIAAQLGIEVPTAEPAQSPQFYVELLRSRHFLTRADGRYPTVSGDSAALRDLLRIGGRDSSVALQRVAARLDDRLGVFVAPRTGVVSATVSMPDPVVAQAVMRQLLDLLDAFNVETRRSRAQAERVFTERRVAELRAELRDAEDALEGFLRTNRITQFSPELTFQRDRLVREVTLRSQVYAMMVQSYEQARIEEVRDTPVLTRLIGPTLPVRPSRQSSGVAAGMGFAIGALLVIGVALLRAFARGELRGG
jgi:uncharacterized protein involved in exopolysaccharide biosynthesis